MTAARKLANTLWDTLKLVRPKSVIAIDTDGKEHKINIPENVGRNRHQHVMIALDGIDWAHVDLLDGKSGLLKRHHRTADDREPAGELEDIVKTRQLSEMSGMLSLMLRAQEVALDRQQKMTAQLLDAHAKLIDSATKRLEASEARLSREIDTNYQLSHDLLAKQLEAAVASAADGEGQSEAGAALAPFVPAIIEAFTRSSARDPSKKPPAPTTPNGHSKSAPAERRSPPPASEREPKA